jgi:putative endonuclease
LPNPASAWRYGAKVGFKSRRPDTYRKIQISESKYSCLYYVYIIHSQSLQRYYVGSTESVEKRLREHNAGRSKSKRAGAPWRLIHTESFATRSDAMHQEQKIKARGIGRYLASIKG